MGTQPLPQKGRSPTQFSAYVYCGQTAAWIKMPLGTEVDLGLRDIVFDAWTQLPPEKSTPTPTQFLAHVYSGQMAGWMKTPLSTEVDLAPGHTVQTGWGHHATYIRRAAITLGIGPHSSCRLFCCTLQAADYYVITTNRIFGNSSGKP